jgi:hypothetical protein
VIDSHEVLDAAVHVHPVVVVTETLPVDAAEVSVADVGDTVYVHGAAACVTVIV